VNGLLQQLDGRGVLTLTLDRPKVHNAFDAGLVAALADALEAAGQDSQVRIVVLTGAGASFSAGADMRWMRNMAEADEAENERDALQLAWAWWPAVTLPWPPKRPCSA
jgi:methylglutaconyl-CoA hydratase